MSDSKNAEMVTLTIDGTEVQVPKGTNLIEAAKAAGVDVPYYCYHPHLSVAGNCRMCQVKIGGSPKLAIACNTQAAQGMVVNTQESAEDVANSQRATLEFLLINHPLDCTVCDQAGHCKLQDYYYEYNKQPSRFLEEKVHKVKAEVLGPEIVYDGERCILCTRCVRFCDEVTKTSELAVFNRGDHAVIGIQDQKELANPLAGCVVDLCPVGALTHRRWRFNSRIWYTDQKDTVCTGCSTGCSAKVAVRDGEVVQVKARLNSAVNQEWMCDEGRYGFGRFQPPVRLSEPLLRQDNNLVEAGWDQALQAGAKLKAGGAEDQKAVFLSPFLTLEELWLAFSFAEKVMGLSAASHSIAMQLKLRELTEVEAVLISPDYAPNARAVNLFGVALTDTDWRTVIQVQYENLLQRVRHGGVKQILIIGDGAIRDQDLDQALIAGILAADTSVALTPRGVLTGERGETEQALGAHQFCQSILPGRTVNEKNGIMVNRQLRFQRLYSVLTPPSGSQTEWFLLAKLAKAAGVSILPESITDDRALFREMTKAYAPFNGLTLARIGDLGLAWEDLKNSQQAGAVQAQAGA